MKRLLPPLNAIKAFEAAGRLRSVSQAADELNVTQGAVSKQIQSLEAYLNTELFTRKVGGISLTSEGQRYLYDCGDVLDRLGQATKKLKHLPSTEEVLTVDVSPSFASLWLLPNLRDFNKKHANIYVEVMTGKGAINFANSQADCAFRCLPSSAAPKQSELLFRERLQCVASKALYKDNPIYEVKDLQKHRLIPHTTRPYIWHRLFEHHNLPEPSHQLTACFDHFFLTLLAAQNGFGLCLVPEFLLRKAQGTNEVTGILDMSIDTGFGYFWQAPSYKVGMNKVQVFYRWLRTRLLAEHTSLDSKNCINLNLT
ncbi:MAG: LysR substrate-binding domain-containing protein [Aestuariibacter sp.]